MVTRGLTVIGFPLAIGVPALELLVNHLTSKLGSTEATLNKEESPLQIKVGITLIVEGLNGIEAVSINKLS